MNGWQIFITVMVLYWSDIITGPILYIKREVGHWFDIRDMKRDAKAIKEAKKKGMSTDEMVEEEILHELKREPYEPPKKLDTFIWWVKRIFWWGLLEHPEDFRRWLIHKYQRAKRGWSNRDTWGFSWFLSEVIIGGLEYLKKTKHGIPCAFGNSRSDNSDKEFKKCEDKWNAALHSMIFTFKISQEINDNHWFYQNSKKYDIKLANRMRKSNRELLKKDPKLWDKKALHVMTKEECKIYEKGWALFQEHFFSLWD